MGRKKKEKKVICRCVQCLEDIEDTSDATYLCDIEDDEGNVVKAYIHNGKCLDDFSRKIADEVCDQFKKDWEVSLKDEGF